MTFHGTKVWDIEPSRARAATSSSRRRSSTTSRDASPSRPATGFDVTVTRIFKKAGKTMRTSNFTTHYIPEDKVTCTHPDAN